MEMVVRVEVVVVVVVVVVPWLPTLPTKPKVSSDDAKNSLSVNLQEFFRYTNNKKTLSTVLTELGWSNKRKKVFTPPLDTKLAETNPTYADILNNKEYSMINQELELSY